ncbi:tetratricopeptide repeat protein [bacterium]|nr:tetratricopeptide repeat protein [bacterium]
MGQGRGARLSILVTAVVLLCSACASMEVRREEADAHYQMANSYLQQERGFQDETNRRMAYPELMEAIRLDPNNASYYLVLGTLYLYSREFLKAESEIRKALDIDPNLGDARNNLGLVFIEQGRLNEAIVEFKKAVDNLSYQTAEVAYFNLGRASFLVGNYTEAAEALNRSLAILPANVEARFFLGRSYVKLGRLRDAEKAFLAALEMDPDAPRTHYELGVVLFKLDRKEEASQHFQQVVKLDPDSEIADQARTYIKLLR